MKHSRHMKNLVAVQLIKDMEREIKRKQEEIRRKRMRQQIKMQEFTNMSP